MDWNISNGSFVEYVSYRNAPTHRMPGFHSGSIHVGFVMDEVPLGQVFLRVLRFFPVIIVTSVHNYNYKKHMIFITFLTGLHKSSSFVASVASAVGNLQ